MLKNRCDNENTKGKEEGFYMWGYTGNERDKPLHGAFVAALLNDLFGIQARGGCACAGPYGHSLLKVDETNSHVYRSAIKKVTSLRKFLSNINNVTYINFLFTIFE